MVKPNYAELSTKYKYSDELIILLSLIFDDNCFDRVTIHKASGQKHVKQEEALTALFGNTYKEIGYGGAAGGSKSWTGAVWQMIMCLAYPGVRYFIAREELKDLRHSTLPTIQKVSSEYGFGFEKYWKFNGQDNIIEFTNGSKIDFLAIELKPSDPEYQWLGSREYTGGWCEETGQAKTQMAYEILKTRIGRQHNDKYGIVANIFNTFNPRKNYVYFYFYERDKLGSLPPTVLFIKALIYDNPHREANYAQQLEAINIPAQRERLLHGNFDYDDDPRDLVDYDAICDLFRNEHVERHRNRYGSADLAMQGRDKFICGSWEGLVGTPLLIKSKCTGIEIEKDIRAMMIAKKIPHSRMIVDSTGMGSYLESYINGIKEFNFAEGALDPEYAKMKDQCAYKLAELIMKREIWLDIPFHGIGEYSREQIIQMISSELACLKARDVDKDGQKKQIIDKKEMKAMLGRSPDFLDWLILRMWYEVQGEPVSMQVVRSPREDRGRMPYRQIMKGRERR